MNPTLILVVVSCAVLGQLAPPPPSSSARSAVMGCTSDYGFIGIAGDSRSTSMIPTSDWPGGMADMIRALDGSLLNLALGGSVATSDVEASWPIERTGPWQVQELIDAEVDLIVIAFGINDINNQDHSAVEVFADLAILAGMCDQANVPYFVATVEYMFPPHQVVNNPVVSDLNDLILTSGWPVLDFAPLTNDAMFTDDGLHTNELGRLVKARHATDVFCALP